MDNNKLDQIIESIGQIKESIGRIEGTLVSLDTRIGSLETDMKKVLAFVPTAGFDNLDAVKQASKSGKSGPSKAVHATR